MGSLVLTKLFALILFTHFCSYFLSYVETLPISETVNITDNTENVQSDKGEYENNSTLVNNRIGCKLKQFIKQIVQEQFVEKDSDSEIKIEQLKEEIEAVKINFEEMSKNYDSRFDRLYELIYCQRDLMAAVYERLNFNRSQTLTWGPDVTEFVANFSRYKCMPRDCMEILFSGETESKIYHIYPDQSTTPIQVYCDMETNGGGWTKLLHRGIDQIVDFNRSWQNYENGFGNLSGEHFIGLQNLYTLSKSHDQVLRVDFVDWENVSASAQYEKFWLGDAEEKYNLNIGHFSGDAGDSLSDHDGFEFTTYDQDNDSSEENCAIHFGGGWWYDDCFESNLMGRELHWYEWNKNWNPFLRTATMRIRNINFQILSKKTKTFMVNKNA